MLIYVTLTDKDYVSFIMTLVVCFGMAAISIPLYRLIAMPARRFFTSETDVILEYDDHNEVLEISDISKIEITIYRYIFYDKNDKKHTVTRYVGYNRAEKEVDPRIIRICEYNFIPYHQYYYRF